jgi:hypothetical protein
MLTELREHSIHVQYNKYGIRYTILLQLQYKNEYDSFVLTKMAPNSASAMEETTLCLRTVEWQRSGPLVRGVCGF